MRGHHRLVRGRSRRRSRRRRSGTSTSIDPTADASGCSCPGGIQNAPLERDVVGVRLADRNARRSRICSANIRSSAIEARLRVGEHPHLQRIVPEGARHHRGDHVDVFRGHPADRVTHVGRRASAPVWRDVRTFGRPAPRSAHAGVGERRRPPSGPPEPPETRAARSARAGSRRRSRTTCTASPTVGRPSRPATRSTRPRPSPTAPRCSRRSARPRSCCSRHDTTRHSRRCPAPRCARSSTSGPSAPTALLARPEVEYVLVFENRGREVGATIDHPHGQIYGYPFVPPAPAREGDGEPGARLRRLRGGRARARRPARASSCEHDDWIAYVPFAAAYPYGMRLAPLAHVGVASRARRRGARRARGVAPRRARSVRPAVARAERRTTSFPYLLWFHQAPAAGGDEWHVHGHTAPPLRSAGRAALRRVR